MGNTADVAQGHQTHTGYEGRMGKGVAHIPPGKGRRSLWVLGELVTYKIPSQQTGGAYALFGVITLRPEGHTPRPARSPCPAPAPAPPRSPAHPAGNASW
jgi:hypothetical protein